jgi:hypothetical protein
LDRRREHGSPFTGKGQGGVHDNMILGESTAKEQTGCTSTAAATTLYWTLEETTPVVTSPPAAATLYRTFAVSAPVISS